MNILWIQSVERLWRSINKFKNFLDSVTQMSCDIASDFITQRKAIE